MLKQIMTKLTITLMAAGTLYATTATASANTQAAPSQPTTTALSKQVARPTKLALNKKHQPQTAQLTPKASRIVTKSAQSHVLDTIDASSQSLTKLKYIPTAQ